MPTRIRSARGRHPQKAAPQAQDRSALYAALAHEYAGYALVLDEGGRVEFSNRYAPLLPDDVLGKEVTPWLGLDHDATRAALTRVLQHSGDAHHEFRADLPDGTAHWYRARLKRFAAPGMGMRLLLFVDDVGERRGLEDAPRQTQAQKMESIGRLAGGVAHDFNNLLTAIISFSRFVMDDLAPGDPRRGDLAEVLKAADSASRLTNQLLAFSRKRPVEPQLLDVNDSIRLISRVLRRTLEESIELRIVESPEPLAVMCDPGQLDQLVMNLALNARDAMPGGGTVTFEIARRRVVGHRELADGDYVALSVIDTGSGMSEEVMRQIFEPFFTTKGAKGAGLGLATCYGIAKQAQGDIEVTSRAKQGSAFHVLLPLAQDRLAAAAKATPVEAKAQSKLTGLALVVEDQAPIRGAMTRSLQLLGLNVLEARTAEEALAVVEDLGAKVDLLVTDVVLPGLSGVKLCQRLRAQQPDIRVLVCSGYMGREQDTGIVVDENTGFLPKPFTGAELISRVAGLFRQSTTVAERAP